jgi:hypothetical protein
MRRLSHREDSVRKTVTGERIRTLMGQNGRRSQDAASGGRIEQRNSSESLTIVTWHFDPSRSTQVDSISQGICV